jgi:hypothetical protein
VRECEFCGCTEDNACVLDADTAVHVEQLWSTARDGVYAVPTDNRRRAAALAAIDRLLALAVRGPQSLTTCSWASLRPPVCNNTKCLTAFAESARTHPKKRRR